MKIINILIVFLLTGCASVPKDAILVDDVNELPSVKAENSALLSQLFIGMTLQAFKEIVPKAYVGGQNKQTTAYELVHIQKYVVPWDLTRQNLIWGAGSPNKRTKKQILWFYFYNNQLVQWGLPEDWPEKPDFILEQRIKTGS